MKSLGVCVVVIAAIAPVAVVAARPTVRLFQPPPGQLHFENLWRVDINNPDDTTYAVWIEGRIVEARKGEVFWARTHEFRLPPGLTAVSYRTVRVKEQRHASGYEEFAARAGGLPEGDYTFMVWLMPDLGGDTGRIRVQQPTPSRLISPRDGASLSEPYPNFVWTAPGRHTGGVTYKLTVVEILPGQSVEEALKANPVWFEKSGIRGTSFRYPTSARPVEKDRRYAWQVTAVGRGIQPLVSDRWGFRRTLSRQPMRAIAPLKITRAVTRNGNWYQVLLTLTNTGLSNLTGITLTDSHRYFQCIDDARRRRVPPPGGEQFPGWTTQWERAPQNVYSAYGGFRGIIKVDLEDWILPPGQSFTVSYSVLPLLTVSIMGPGHGIGVGLKATYRIGDTQHAREYNAQALYPVPGLADAWKAADYIIATCPARLFGANPGDSAGVDRLLVTMAELAKAKKGAPLYFTGSATTAATARATFKAFGTVMKNKWQNGYVLLVGEDEIIPCWDTVVPVPDRPIPNCDHQYADLEGDAAPEVKVGRIIGTTAADLNTGIRNSLDVFFHIGGAQWSGASALMLTGLEQPSKGDNFTKEGGEGANYLHIQKGMQATHWGMEYITTRRTVIDKALKHTKVENGGAGTGASLGSFTTEQLAAWLLEITVGLPALHAQDQPFTDTEGRPRRVPFGFDDDDIRAASEEAEDIENARRSGWVNQQYGYPGSVGDSCALQLRQRLPGNEAIFFSAHGGEGATNFDRLNTNVVNTIDFASEGTRPAIISFTCFVGNYAHQAGSIARALMRQGCAAHIGYSAMTSTGWFRDHVGSPHTFLQFWSKNKKLGDILFDWKLHLSIDPGADARLVPGYNLYGDPKLGGS